MNYIARMEKALPDYIKENKDLRNVLLEQEGGIIKYLAGHLDVKGRDALFKDYQKQCADDFFEANMWEMSEEEIIRKALGYGHMEKELDYQTALQPVIGGLPTEVAEKVNRNIDEYLKFAYKERRRRDKRDEMPPLEFYREVISLYHSGGLACNCMDLLLREHRLQGREWRRKPDTYTEFRIRQYSDIVLSDLTVFAKLRKAVAEMLNGKTDKQCRQMAVETMEAVRGFSQRIYNDGLVQYLREVKYPADDKTYFDETGKHLNINCFLGNAEEDERDGKWLRDVAHNILNYKKPSMLYYFANFVYLLMDIGRIWAAQLLIHHTDMHELETEVRCILKPVVKPIWCGDDYIDYGYYRDKNYTDDLPNEYCVYDFEQAEELLGREKIERHNAEKRDRLMETNTVLQVLTKRGKPKIDILKLYKFIDLHFANEIKHKYEWYALRRFLDKYVLLQEDRDNVQFEEQMNHEEWFGYLKEEHQCSSNEMNIYNYFNNVHPDKWLDVTIPKGSRATRKAMENLYKAYQNLELFKDEITR